MILVDSSVWIDHFRGIETSQTTKLRSLLGVEELLTGDLILAEVLQGFRHEKDFRIAKRYLAAFRCVQLGGSEMAVATARAFRDLRARGITVRKTIDGFIATCCIENGYQLLHCDRDFDAYEQHFGLRVVKCRD